MKTSIHLLFSSILAIVLYPILGWKVLFVLVGGVLIDFDHVLWYLFKYKKLNIAFCYDFFIDVHERRQFDKVKGILIIFHTIEFLVIMLVLSFYNEFILAFTIGIVLHYLLDLTWNYFVLKGLVANHSVMSWIIKNKIQKV